jgi:iron complex outermembrane receptor protein
MRRLAEAAAGGRRTTLFVEARNLTDEEAREHASFLKDLAPLPGRNFRMGLAYRF